MKLLSWTILFILVSCSTSNQIVVQGYGGTELRKALQKIEGKNHEQILKILGTPAIHGLCKDCNGKKLYKIIYLEKDMAKFYADLFKNTDSELSCVVLDLFWYPKKNQYVFYKKIGFSEIKKCNQKDGAILKFQEVLDLQEKEEAELAAKKSKK